MIEVRTYPFRNEFTDEAFSIYANGRRVLDVGFKVQNLLTRTLYMWAWPHIALPQLSYSDWRELRCRLDSFGEATIIANIYVTDATAIRFAQFFGFRPLQLVDDRLIMERKVH